MLLTRIKSCSKSKPKPKPKPKLECITVPICKPCKKRGKRKIRRTRRRGPSLRSQVRRLRREQLLLAESLRRLTEHYASLYASMNQIQSDVNILQNQVTNINETISDMNSELLNIINQLRARIGTQITIDTAAGTLTGVLQLVGEDFVQIQEATGSVVIIRISEINSFI